MKKTTMDLLKNILLVVLIAAVSILLYDKFTQKDGGQSGQIVQMSQGDQESQGNQAVQADQGNQETPVVNQDVQAKQEEPMKQEEPTKQEEPAAAVHTDNYLDITIDGERYLMQLKSAETSRGSIIVTYIANDPRGKEMLRVEFSLDEDIVPGRYSTGSDDRDVKITIKTRTDGYYYMHRYRAEHEKRTFELNITSRSADWLTYTGTLAGTAADIDGEKSITITNAAFAFTLQN